jgi:hypothetical protein
MIRWLEGHAEFRSKSKCIPVFRTQMFERLIGIFTAQRSRYYISVYLSDILELYSITLPTLSYHTFQFGANLPLAEPEVIFKSVWTTLDHELKV